MGSDLIKERCFANSFESLMQLEGGFNDIAEDKGGATNYGISLRFMTGIPNYDADINNDGHVNRDDIIAIDKADAKFLYKKYFWDYYGIDRIESPFVKEKVFHTYVNMRGLTVGKIIQRAVRANGIELVEDGIVGSKTIKALNEYGGMILPAFRSEQASVYRMIVHKDYTQKKFLNGWLNRAYRS